MIINNKSSGRASFATAGGGGIDHNSGGGGGGNASSGGMGGYPLGMLWFAPFDNRGIPGGYRSYLFQPNK
ncbi:MAG: hypothetical protein IPP72_17415 [Chitinophagaceae bacterium]|nr:hypothetical protein [Chitinophagaceae bacterium]